MTTRTPRRSGAALALALTAVVLALTPGVAQAKNLYTLDAAADSSGPVVVDAAGNGYITWLRKANSPSLPDSVMFCKVPPAGRCTTPLTLPLPAGSNGADGATSQPYAVLAPDDEVWIVAPRYTLGDIVYWVSENGGQSFSAPVDVSAPNDYADGTNVDGVLLEPNEPYLTQTPPVAFFDIASTNPGVGYSWLPSNLVAGGSQMTGFDFTSPGSGGVGGASLGQQPDGFPLEAYWNDSSPSQVLFYRQTVGDGTVAQPIDAWTSTPTLVGDGYLPQLASGPKGLFLAYEAYPAGRLNDTPSVLDFARFNPTTESFGAARKLVTDPQADTSLHDGGTINENGVTGHIAVVWPLFGSAGDEMRLWLSTNGGSTFTTEGDIATFGSSYAGSASLALDGKNGGFLTWVDSQGLRVADLVPTARPSHRKKRKRR
jgi:hypothetical protein